MVAVVKKKRTSRMPCLMVPTDSVSSMRSSTERSVSSNSLQKGNTEACHTKSPIVSFAQDYGCSDTVWPPAPPMTAEEIRQSFYNIDDLHRFDKDRALTVLMYRTRKNNGVPWDDNVHSLRGLEETLHQRKDEKTRRGKREEYVKAVLAEQERLASAVGQEELEAACRAIHKPPDELMAELIRGVSCLHSKADKHRALALAMKDQKASVNSNRHGSARRLMKQVRTKLYGWASTSSRSLVGNSERNCSGSSTPERGSSERGGGSEGEVEDSDKDAAQR